MRGRAKKKFLAAHPICCFCGGLTPATEVDHQPSESLYSGSSRPRALIFPACSKCNRLSHKAESKLPLIFPEETDDPIKVQQFRDFVDDHGNWQPKLIPSMMPSKRELRNILRKENLELPPGLFLDDLPLITLPHEEWHPILDLFCQKLILALHYRYQGIPLTRNGRIWFDRLFKFDLAGSNTPAGLNDLINASEEDLAIAISDQLNFGRFEENGVHWYVINIRNQMLIYGFSTEISDVLPASSSESLLSPLFM